MGRLVLKRDVALTLWGKDVTLPKGTPCRMYADRYAIADKTLLVRLTGNASAPFSSYAFVPDDAVYEIPSMARPATPIKRYRR